MEENGAYLTPAPVGDEPSTKRSVRMYTKEQAQLTLIKQGQITFKFSQASQGSGFITHYEIVENITA